MPKKIGVIVLVVLVSIVLVRSYRVNIESIFNQKIQKKEIAKEISHPKIEYDPMMEAQDFVDTENKDIKPSTETIRQKSQIQDEIMGYRLKSKDKTKQAQAALKKIGFYKGDIDGKMGVQTKKAIKAFQKSKDLNPDGVIGVRTWEEIAKILKK